MRISKLGFKGLSLLAILSLVISYNACVRGFMAENLEFASSSNSPLFFESVDKGKTLYSQNCKVCHGEITQSTIHDASVANITTRLASVPAMSFLRGLFSEADINNISLALKNPNAPAPSCSPNLAGFVNVRRLNRYEYNNVIRDLTGIDFRPADHFPADAYGLFYSNIAATLGVDLSLAENYFQASAQILDDAFSKARSNIVTCDPNSGHRACAEKIIREFGLKAFRRPLVSAEANQFLALYDSNRASFPSGAGNIFDESLKAPLQAILMSPQFLFQIVDRTGYASGAVKTLNDYELASRLSFFIWGSIPDAPLFDLAAKGMMGDKTVLAQQVDRMLKDPKSSHLIDVFAAQWLKLEKFKQGAITPDATAYPDFDENIRQSMITETRMLLQDIIQKDGSPYLLLNANYSYLNQQLADYYGISGPSSSQFTKTSLEGTDRVGILTHGSVLISNSKAIESSIVFRGVWALDRLLCAPPGMPPPNTNKDLPVGTESLNPQKGLEAHISRTACAACHARIDPVGISLEIFDGSGKYRTQYWNGDAINTQGQFPPPSNASFNGPREMSQALGNAGSYNTCVARHLLNFSLGRELSKDDLCTADLIGKANVTPTSKFSDLVKAIVTSEPFLKQAGGD